jgi:solute carrier family 35 protein C2
MSIAGIAKEVSTITISAWTFGDQLTPLNITGVGITVAGTCCLSHSNESMGRARLMYFAGIALFTYHKYRKSIDSPIPLDAHGNPIPEGEEGEDEEERAHLTGPHHRGEEDDEVRKLRTTLVTRDLIWLTLP